MERNWIVVLVAIVSAALLLGACASAEPVPTATNAPTHVVEEESQDEHMEEEAEEHDDAEADHEATEHDEDEAEHSDEEEGGDHEHLEVPSEYEELDNPFDGDPDAITSGADLYAINCATCHGLEGMGDGPAAAALDPKPAPLADADMMADMTDGYIFWRITEGGAMEPFNSAMPSWKAMFSEQQIWQLVSFLRTLPEEN
ncbi:MAG: cytochrome c [Anaerolineales bacterium]|nr:cytochrome c [Anaerolineales bacterium]